MIYNLLGFQIVHVRYDFIYYICVTESLNQPGESVTQFDINNMLSHWQNCTENTKNHTCR